MDPLAPSRFFLPSLSLSADCTNQHPSLPLGVCALVLTAEKERGAATLLYAPAGGSQNLHLARATLSK